MTIIPSGIIAMAKRFYQAKTPCCYITILFQNIQNIRYRISTFVQTAKKTLCEYAIGDSLLY